MEKVNHYRQIVRQLVSDLGTRKNKSGSSIKYQVITDDKTGNYLLLRNGWKGETRFYGAIVHIEVTDVGKVWLHQDNTDLVVADMLLEQGVPAKDIVLGFHAPIMRPETEFALG
ncbi:MAG: XisI protein [Saprospiraceae bacterium]